MRRLAFVPLVASALLIAAAPALSQQQQKQQQQPLPPPGQNQQQQQPLPPPGQSQQQQQQQPAPSPPQPYQPVAIKPPAPMNDAGFDAFRNQIIEIAKRKDRAALTKMIAKDFFWLGEQGDRADKTRPGIDNLTRALGLSAQDGSGWEVLGGYAADPTAMPLPEKRDTVCAPADPVFEIKDLENLARTTSTDEAEWGYPMQPGVEVRSAAQPNAPVIEKLGLHFVRVLEDDSAMSSQTPMIRVVTPSGKVGYVAIESLSPLGSDQLCYVKDGAGWRIAGFIGGEQ